MILKCFHGVYSGRVVVPRRRDGVCASCSPSLEREQPYPSRSWAISRTSWRSSRTSEAQVALEGFSRDVVGEGRMAECFLVMVKKVASTGSDTLASPFAFCLMLHDFFSGISVKAKPRQKVATLT